MLDNGGIRVARGSACTTGSRDPSLVLTAMGVNPMRARGCVRFSLGIYNTAQEVDYLIEKLPPIIAKLRASSPADPSDSHTRPSSAARAARALPSQSQR